MSAPNQRLIDMLELYLEQAKSGFIIGLSCTIVFKGPPSHTMEFGGCVVAGDDDINKRVGEAIEWTHQIKDELLIHAAKEAWGDNLKQASKEASQ
jgi:hypothetical protein